MSTTVSPPRAPASRSLLYRNGVALALNSVLSSLVGAAYWLVAARRTTPSVVGEATALLAALVALAMIGQLSLPGVLATYLPRAGVSARRLVVRAYAVAVGVSLLLGAAFVAVAPRVSEAFHPLGQYPALLLFPLAVAVWAIFSLQDNVLTGLRRAVWVPLENTLYSATKLVALLALGSGATAMALLATWVVPGAIALVPVSGILLIRMLPRHMQEHPGRDFGGIRSYFAGDTAGLVFSQLSTTLLPVLVIVRLGASANGAFGIAWLLAQSLDLVAINLGMSLTVEGAHDERRLPAMLRSLRFRVLLIVSALAAVGIAGAVPLLSIFGASYATQGASVLRLLLIGSLGRAITVLAICAARARRRPLRIVHLQAALAALVPTLAWVLAGPLGLAGVGLAWAIAQLTVAAGALVTERDQRVRRPAPAAADRAPTILCVNHWHDDNKGDSAITAAIVGLVRERWPGAEVRVSTLHEAASASADGQLRHVGTSHEIVERHSLAATELGSGRGGRHAAWRRQLQWLARSVPLWLEIVSGRPRAYARRELAGVDLVVAVGGSNVYDDPDVAAPFSLARLASVLYPVWAAGRCDVPVVLAGHTLGPFPRRGGRWLARRMLRGVRATVLREATSRDMAAALGLANVRVRPDMAFATGALRSERVEALLAELPAGPLALVVRRHPHAGGAADERLLRAFAGAARRMVAAGDAAGVLVVAHCHGPTDIEDDRPLSRTLAADLADLPEIRLVEDDLAPGELAALYGACSAVVTVRLHAAILALAQGTPAFAVSYMTRKTEGVMGSVGPGGAWCAFEDADPVSIAAAVRRLLAHGVEADLLARAAAARSNLRAEVATWGRPSPAC